MVRARRTQIPSSCRLLAVALCSCAGACGDDQSEGTAGQTDSTTVGTTSTASATGASASTNGASASTDPSSPTGAQTDTEATISFADDVLPMLRTRCTACHHDNSAIDIDIADPFGPPNGVVGSVNTWAVAHPEGMTPMLNIEPGNPAGSFLLDKIGDPALLDGPTAGGHMPANLPSLTAQEVADLRAWIDAGAADDAMFTDTIRPIFGDETRLGAAGGKCTYCHHSFSGGVPPNLTDPFDAANGAVGVVSFVDPGRMRIEPGSADNSVLVLKVEGAAEVGERMPLHFEALTPEEITIIETWISEGALNN